MEITEIQAALRDARVDGWLFYDHHYRDPLGYRILGLGDDLHVTRRWFYFVPAVGEPRKLVHRIESGRLDPLPGTKTEYSSWQELEAGLEAMLAGQTRSPCSTPRATPSCTSRWSTPAPSSCCAPSAKRSSAPPTSSASSRPS